jgi:amino acid adenylation domain-containing protein
MHEHPPAPQALASDAKRALLERLLRERAERADGVQRYAEPGSIPRVARDAPLPVSFSQHRLWFFEQLVPGTAVYNIHLGLRLTGVLDVNVLARALSVLIERHEALRTRLAEADGAPVQIVDPPYPVTLAPVDLHDLPADARDAAATQHAETEAGRPFDIATGPLFPAALLRLASDEHHLLMTMHHAVSDGWSAALLVRELCAAYDALTQGRRPALPPLTIQYGDYAAWQRQHHTGEHLDWQLAYWKRRLEGPLPVLDLPADGARPDTPTFDGGTDARLLPAPLVAELKALGRANGATLFMTLLAAFSVVVSRLAGQDDIVVGSPIAGRTRPETEHTVGCFINALPLRIRLAGQLTFAELLARVRSAALEAVEHQDVPFERIADEVQPARDRSRSPLFQVLFNMLGVADMWRSQAGGVTFELLPSVQEPSKFDLTLYAGETGETAYLRAVYTRHLYRASRIAEILAQLESLLRQVTEDAAKPVSAYSLVTERARRVLPDPAAPLPAAWAGSVVDRVAAHASRTPDAVAVAHADTVWSYRDLDAASDAVAEALDRAAIGRSAVVAVCARRAPELVAALLGVWKAGAAFVVLDPAYPAARLVAILDAAQPQAWLDVAGDPPAALAALAARFTGAARIAVRGPIAAPVARARTSNIGPDDLAYVAFTSGSTGAPKGILGTHGPISHFMAWHAETFGLCADDRVSLLAGLSHDPLLRDLIAPLWVGASIHIPEETVVESGTALGRWMRSAGVTLAHITPAMADRLAQGGREAGAMSLRLACFGGDTLTARDVERLRAVAPAVRIVNFYGATETPQAMGWHEVRSESPAPAVVPAGVGIEGVQLLVLTDTNQLAGIGELGEVCVRTPYLAVGYLDPAAGSDRFITNPFTGRADDRVYRTGDLGRYDVEGRVIVAGRRDTQVKVRGFRIELGEVEAALEAYPAIRRALVLARGESSTDRTLHACLVADEPRPEEPALRAFLRLRLPEHMLPARFSFLDALPLTPNGKVDRGAAAVLADAKPDVVRPFLPPATPIEEAVSALWRELLGAERVGLDDSFFALGGHSLLATRLTARLEAAFGVTLPLRQLFDAPTLGDVALAITERMLDAELADEGMAS